MSIHKLSHRSGQWQVRWREGGRQRTRLFAKKGDAQAFELEIRRKQQLGPLAGQVMVSRMTLAEFVEQEWWPRYAIPNLQPSTLDAEPVITDLVALAALGTCRFEPVSEPLLHQGATARA